MLAPCACRVRFDLFGQRLCQSLPLLVLPPGKVIHSERELESNPYGVHLLAHFGDVRRRGVAVEIQGASEFLAFLQDVRLKLVGYLCTQELKLE